MQNDDQKFFEELARSGGGSSDIPEEVDIRLAKAAPAEPAVKTALQKKQSFATDEAEGQLTIDVYQTPSDIVIESAIAGVKPEDIDIDVSPDALTIRGERRRETEVEEEDYFYRECYWGRFSRSIILPQEIDPESASVSFKNGVLTVRLPKLDKKKTKKLRVSSS